MSTIKTRQDVKNLLIQAGVYRADITESSVGTMLIFVLPVNSPNRERLREILHRDLPTYIAPVILYKNKNWIKNRKKYTYAWRVV